MTTYLGWFPPFHVDNFWPSAVLGALLSRRIPGWVLSAAFAALMILVAIYTVVHTLLTS